MRVCLEQVRALPWPQATHILDQALSMRMSDGLVHIHSNLIDAVDEFTVKGREQVFLHHVLLRKEARILMDKMFCIWLQSCLSFCNSVKFQFSLLMSKKKGEQGVSHHLNTQHKRNCYCTAATL